jgi:UDP-N-acetylmuramyl pentapeptide synthase
MRELGDFCKDEHELFATYISTLDVEKYFLVGESMRIYALPILEQAGKDVVRNVSSREL